jgi:hypothetical protein
LSRRVGAYARCPIWSYAVKQRQREPLQIEPADPFGVFGIQAMPLDAMLSEFVTATVQFAFAETGHRRTPIAIRGSATNVSFGARKRFGSGHRKDLQPLVYQTNLSIVWNF